MSAPFALSLLDSLIDPALGEGGLLIALGEVALSVQSTAIDPLANAWLISVRVIGVDASDPAAPRLVTRAFASAPATSAPAGFGAWTPGLSTQASNMHLGSLLVLDEQRVLLDWLSTMVLDHLDPAAPGGAYSDANNDYGATVISWDGAHLRIGAAQLLHRELLSTVFQPATTHLGVDVPAQTYLHGPELRYDFGRACDVGAGTVAAALTRIDHDAVLTLVSPAIGTPQYLWEGGFNLELLSMALSCSGDSVALLALSALSDTWAGMFPGNQDLGGGSRDQDHSEVSLGALHGRLLVAVIGYAGGHVVEGSARIVALFPGAQVAAAVEVAIPPDPDTATTPFFSIQWQAGLAADQIITWFQTPSSNDSWVIAAETGAASYSVPAIGAFGPFEQSRVLARGAGYYLISDYARDSVFDGFATHVFYTYQLHLYDRLGAPASSALSRFEIPLIAGFSAQPYALVALGAPGAPGAYVVQLAQYLGPGLGHREIQLLGARGLSQGEQPHPLRLQRRDDGLGISAHPRLRARQGATSTQLRAAPRVGGKATYS